MHDESSQPIRAVIFDMDDTLLMTKQTRWEAVKYAASTFYGVSLTDDEISKHWGKLGIYEMFTTLFKTKDSPEQNMEKYLSILPQFPNRAYKGAVELVGSLAKSLPLGIVSSTNHALIEADIVAAGFNLDWFVNITGVDDTPASKPDPKVFDPSLSILVKQGIEPEEVLYVGDGLHDYKAARGAGLQFIGMANRTTPKLLFDQVGAITVNDFAELSLRIAG